MKVGDKLYCIKTTELRDFTLDKCYEILYTKVGKTYKSEYSLLDDNKRDITEYIIYYILNDRNREDVFNEYNICEYFVSKQESRKLKIEKLNDSVRQ